MEWFFLFCVLTLLLTQCNSKSILDMESEMSVLEKPTKSAPAGFSLPHFAPNLFIGLTPRTKEQTEITPTDSNRWLGPQIGPNVIEDPYVDLIVRRRSANSLRKSKTGQNNRNYHLPDAGGLTSFSVEPPKERKNYLNDPATLKVIREEDEAKNRSLGYPVITTTTEQVVTDTVATEAVNEFDKTTKDDKNHAVLEFIEELKKKYNNTQNDTEAMTNNNIPELRDETGPRELNNTLDFDGEDYFNLVTTTPKMDMKNSEVMEQVLKYLSNTNPIDGMNQRKKKTKPRTPAPPEEPSSSRGPEILEDYDEIPELREDEGSELNVYSFLELIRNVFSGIYRAVSAVFNKRKQL